ncbi:TMEM43 family protein [Frateuria aurantia]
MRSRATRQIVALICLIAAVLTAAWNWRQQHPSGPPDFVTAPPMPALTASRSGPPAAASGGATELADPPTDPVFGQQAQTPLLRRVVEMFQLDPASPGGHSLRWADHALDVDASAHRDFPIASAEFFAGVAQLDGRWLSHQAIRELGGSTRVPPQQAGLPQNMQASFSVSGDYLVSSSDPSHPQPGDLRISWTAVNWPPAATDHAGHAETALPAAPTAAGSLPSRPAWRSVAVYLLSLALLLLGLGLLLDRRRRS